MTCRLFVVLALILALSIPCSSQNRRQPSASQQLRAQDIAKAILPSVVLLVAKGSDDKSVMLGTGFYVATDVIATNYHVIKDATAVESKSVAVPVSRKVVGTRAIDREHDLALLATDYDISAGYIDDEKGNPIPPSVHKALYKPLSLANGSSEIGESVYVAGNPEGLEGTFSQGIVSSVREDDYIQITAPISPGSSGGPVVNQHAEVIGVATAAFREGQNLNFAVPIAHLKSLIARMSASVQPFRRTSNQPTLKTPQPSREETAQWLTDKLAGLSAFTPTHFRTRIETLTFTNLTAGCYMALRTSIQTGSSKTIYRYEPSMSLAEGATAGTWYGEPVVWLSFRQNIYEYESLDEQGKQEQGNRTSLVTLYVGDSELGGRVSRAFSHLIALCDGGVKKEPL